jgi:acyl phosphate:glycerol-3-phosphate acyltransferase
MAVGIGIALFGYLLGSVPTGLLLARLFSTVDPRKEGSKNIGATNIFRTAGKGLGILTLIGDALKGAIPVCVAGFLNLPPLWIAVAGLSPFLGHIFPVFLGFKGGKGVATALGVYLVICWPAVLIEFILFAGIVWKWRYISLGSILTAATIPFLVLFFKSDSPVFFGMSLAIAALIVARHRANISRLRAGKENKWKAR